MAASLHDIVSQLQYDLSNVPGLVSAYCTVEMGPRGKLHLWTLIEQRDEGTEQRIVWAERRLVHAFPMVAFDFTTTHLLGRNPLQFIPEGSIPIIPLPSHLDAAVNAGP